MTAREEIEKLRETRTHTRRYTGPPSKKNNEQHLLGKAKAGGKGVISVKEKNKSSYELGGAESAQRREHERGKQKEQKK